MNEMVERVSILLRRSERDPTDSGYRELARDVMREMREPTDAMCFAGRDALASELTAPDALLMGLGYSAMIDAALAP